MEEIIKEVIAALPRAGLVEVEISARHVHLSQGDVEILFGKGSNLTPKRDLSQTGQFLAEERVTLIGSKSRKGHTAVLGPARESTQVELSRSDCMTFGVKAPLRDSGDVAGSGEITLEGPCGTITVTQGAIIAKNHIHLTPDIAALLGLKEKQLVSVEVFTERPITFQNVVIRIDKNFRCRMHLDVDEANAAMVSGFTLGNIKK